jgi:glycosyltransferase 2 family protein
MSKWVPRIFGYGLAAGGLIWVLKDVHPRELLARLVIRDWRWAAAAIAADILAYVAQGWRWSMLLSPLGRMRPLRATQAIYAGLFANEVLPLRAGELVRARLVSRWLGRRFIEVIPSIALERLMDGVWLAMAVGAIALFVPLPRRVEHAADVFGTVVLAGVCAFVYLTFSRRLPALRQITVTGRILQAAVISLLVVTLQAMSFWLVMRAYGLDFSFWVGAAVFLIVHIGTAIPNAPGNIGSYQLFTVLGLTLFGVEKTTASAFSVVVFVFLSFPLLIIGAFALARTHAGSISKGLKPDDKFFLGTGMSSS